MFFTLTARRSCRRSFIFWWIMKNAQLIGASENLLAFVHALAEKYGIDPAEETINGANMQDKLHYMHKAIEDAKT